MVWCTFYQKEVDLDDLPQDSGCKAPESLLQDVISCGDCDCFKEQIELQCPSCQAMWNGKTFTHFMGPRSCQVCGTVLEHED